MSHPQPPKAYKNEAFLNGPNARLIRLLSEYLEPQTRLEAERVDDTVVFFGSARIRPREECQKQLDELRQRRHLEKEPNQPTNEEIQGAERALTLSRYYEDASILAQLIVRWAQTLDGDLKRLLIATGGGPGIMEAANRGAREAGGQSIGFSISLPMEQKINEYVPEELAFEFHYFFMRKFWLVHPAKALIIFPGGFGTLDEAFEVMTLVQTHKIGRQVPILFYGPDYWKDVLHIEAMAHWGTISPGDVDLIHYCDDPYQAFEILKRELTRTGHVAG